MTSTRESKHARDDTTARDAVRDVILSYALAIDSRDFPRVAACFADDAQATYAGVEVPHGRDAICAWLEANVTFVASTHLLAPPLIEVRGDRADAITPAVAFLLEEEGGRLQLRTRGLRYTDTLERRDGSWQIVRRVHEAFWAALQPAAQGLR